MITGRLARALSCVLAAIVAVSCGRGQPSPDAAAELREQAYRVHNRGVGLLEQFAYDRAIGAFEEALTIDPSLRLARINLAIAQFYAGRSAEAVSSARAAQEDYPDAPEAAYVLGLAARAQNQPDEAVRQFERVLRIDSADPGARVYLAMMLLDQRRYQDAAAMAQSALAIEPYNATAAYTVGLALTRAGDQAGGARAMQRFEQLRTVPYATTYSQAYLEQGRYAEAVASSGLEPGLVTAGAPPVTFTDATDATIPAGPGGFTARALALADVDADGDLDLLAGGASLRILRNDGGRFADVGAQLPPAVSGVTGVVAGDVNNDGRLDLLAVTDSGARLLVQGGDGRFTQPGATIQRPVARTAALVDTDHDGDLDVFLGGASAALLRNNGNGTFSDVTAATGVGIATDVVAVAPTDFDNRRDIDLVALGRGSPPWVFRNLRTGAFEDVARAIGMPGPASYSSLAAADVNKDGLTDLLLGRDGAPALWALTERSGRYRFEDAPPATRNTIAAQLLDYDNDGLVDLLAATADGLRLFRNTGRGWQAHQEALRVGSTFPSPVAALAAGDLDVDGDTDLVAIAGGSVRVWRNDGGNANRAVRVALTGRVSNRNGVGAKVEIRAGSLYHRAETAATTPAISPADLTFGLGRRTAADAVRVLWPSGVLQTEFPGTPTATTPARLTLTELDRKPSSCPYLYAWNGERFEFVTDFMGGGEMGYLAAPPNGRNTPDPEEYVRLSDAQLRERNGRLELRVTNELEEVLYLDHLALHAVEHAAAEELVPDEGMRHRPRAFRTYTVRSVRPPHAVVDEHGHDVLPQLARRDRRFVDDFALLPVRGYADDHALVIDASNAPPGGPGERTVLLLTGWTDYAFSSDNVMAHQAGLGMMPPALQVEAPDGTWRTVDRDVGIPVGRPQTLVLDVTPYAARRLRLVTSMRIYWDDIGVGVARVDTPRTSAAPLINAQLRWRGFSREQRVGAWPLSYDYDAVSRGQPWKLFTGRYTREGDVRELLHAADDRFVISQPGDEVVIAFDAAALPPLPPGRRRTFLLQTVGFSKEMDLHSASPDVVEPIPFRRMSRYPYAAGEQYPHSRDLSTFHTRVVPRSIATLVSEASR